MKLITQKYLKSVLGYNPKTGIFIWKKCAGEKRDVKRYLGNIAGGKDNLGRLTVTLKGRGYRLHRLAWLYVYGKWPSNHIDHINMNQSDNRICNLRDVSRSQNQCNRCVQSNNTSGYKGVSFSKLHKRWESYIKINRKRKFLGLFNDPKLAHAAYCRAAKKYHGEFARTE